MVYIIITIEINLFIERQSGRNKDYCLVNSKKAKKPPEKQTIMVEG